jgi:hypothetical protein
MSRDGIGPLVPKTNSQRSAESLPIFALLPVEIWAKIIGSFCDHCRDPSFERPSQNLDQLRKDMATLSALSKTCRLLRDAVQPIMHHQFPFFKSFNVKFDPTRRLYLFIRTLIERRDLASQVRVLRVWIGGYLTRHDPFGPPRFIDEDGMRQIIHLAERLGLTLPRCWGWEEFSKRRPACSSRTAEEEEQGALDDSPVQQDDSTDSPRSVTNSQGSLFLIQLALCLCRNARFVDLSTRPRSACDTIGFIVHRVAEQPASLGVESLHIRGNILLGRPANANWGGYIEEFDLRQLKDLTKVMPMMRTLAVQFACLAGQYFDSDDEDEESPISFSASDLNLGLLTRLDLVFSCMTEVQLVALLSECANLADLTYISMPRDLVALLIFPRGGAAVYPHQVTDILNHHCPNLRKTLRRLTLEHLPLVRFDHPTDGSGVRRLCNRYIGAYSPLANLTSLKEVCLGANGLFISPRDQLILPPPDKLVLGKPLHEILPHNIVSLDIIMAGQWKVRTAAALMQLLWEMKTGRASFRDLKDIRVWSGMPHCPFNPDSREANTSYIEWWFSTTDPRESRCEWDPRVEEMAAAAGIKFGFNPSTVPPLIQRLCSFMPELVVEDR